MSLIESVHARQILDSRGNPTVEVDIITEEWRCSVVLPFRPVPLLVLTKLLNLRDGDKSKCMWAKVC